MGGGCPLAGEHHPSQPAPHHRIWSLIAVLGFEIPKDARHDLATGLAGHDVGDSYPDRPVPALERINHPVLGWPVTQVTALLGAPTALSAMTVLHDHIADVWPDAPVLEIHLAGATTRAWNLSLRAPGA